MKGNKEIIVVVYIYEIVWKEDVVYCGLGGF